MPVQANWEGGNSMPMNDHDLLLTRPPRVLSTWPRGQYVPDDRLYAPAQPGNRPLQRPRPMPHLGEEQPPSSTLRKNAPNMPMRPNMGATRLRLR